jgi:peptide deformylase
LILDLVSDNDPILKTKLERFDFSNPPLDPVEIARNLADTMVHLNGYGLAANQVGMSYRVFAMIGGENKVLACFNPLIVDQTTEEVYLDEGCLSRPGLILNIKRPHAIKVRFTLPNGGTQTQEYTGMTARVFQHELNHLDGIMFTDLVSRLELDIAIRKCRKNMRKTSRRKD